MVSWSAPRLAVLLSVLVATSAYGDLGPTFVVNAYTTGAQAQPSLLRRPDGSYVAVWRSDGQDGDAGGIFARVVRGDGSEVVAEFQVNIATTGDQRDPSAAVTPTGEFVVAWTSINGAESELVARSFGVDALPDTDELPLAGAVGPGAVGLDADRNLVVTYRGLDQVIVAARFDAAGSSIGDPIVVPGTANDAQRPSVATMPSGEFVVVWHDETYTTPGPYSGNYYSRHSSVSVAPFAADAAALPQQAIALGNENKFPRVSADDDGFVVVWSGCRSDPGEYQARPCYDSQAAAQTFAADGTPTSESFAVSGREPGYNRLGPVDVALHDSGRFTVVWDGPTLGEDAHGVVARQFTPGGVDSSSVLLADTLDGDASDVRVAAGPDDSFLTVWEHDGDVLARQAAALEICEEDDCRPARPAEGRLRLRLATADSPTSIRWVWLGEASARTCLADGGMAALSSAVLHFYDQSAVPSSLYLTLEAPVCGTPPCWRYGEHSVVYEDPIASQDGVDLVRFRVGPHGRARLVVHAAGPNVPSFKLPIVMPLAVLFFGGPGTTFSELCTSAVFDQAQHNGSRRFLALGAAAPPP